MTIFSHTRPAHSQFIKSVTTLYLIPPIIWEWADLVFSSERVIIIRILVVNVTEKQLYMFNSRHYYPIRLMCLVALKSPSLEEAVSPDVCWAVSPVHYEARLVNWGCC